MTCALSFNARGALMSEQIVRVVAGFIHSHLL
jgi:hypothetical protein